MKYASFAALLTFGFLAACSPAADPTGRGAFHFQVDDPLAPDLRDESCGVPGIGGIGSPMPENNSTSAGPPDLPTAGSNAEPVNMGSKVFDGQQSGVHSKYQVTCSVTGDSTYTIQAELSGPNSSPYVAMTGTATSLQVYGTINADTGEGTGKVYVRTTETGSISPSSADRPCTLRALSNAGEGSKFRIRPGAVDLTFVCDSNVASISQFSVCESRGTITLEQCIRK